MHPLRWCIPRTEAFSCSQAAEYYHAFLCNWLPLKSASSHLIHGSLGHPSLHPKPHLNRFSHFCTSHRRVSLYFTTGCHFSPPKKKIAGPHLIHGFLDLPESASQTACWSDHPFSHHQCTDIFNASCYMHVRKQCLCMSFDRSFQGLQCCLLIMLSYLES